MKKLVVSLIILVVMGFAIKELIDARRSIKAPEASGYKFYYYPKLNVYYDAAQNNFIYTVDGGMNWQTKKPASPDLPEKLDQKVTIYSPDPDVWIHNATHRQAYKGVSTNYVQRMEDTAQLSAPSAKAKTDTVLSTIQQKDSLVKKDSIAKTEVETKKKPGSWFNRLKEKFKRPFKKNKEQQDDSL